MNTGEKKFCDFKYELSGSFYRSLFETIFKADASNQKRLSKGFPEEVEAVKRYKLEEGYWEELKNEYIEDGL